MIRKIKNYFNQKKEIRTLLLDTIQKANNITTVLSDLTDMLSSMAETFNAEDMKEFIMNMDKIASNPDLTTAYYSQLSRQAHEQKMAELNKES